MPEGGKENCLDWTVALNDLFRELMGRPNVSLYPFQEKMADLLLSDRSVILRAPTGAGKTWAVLLPFLLAKRKGVSLADRVLYALPLRSLASQLYDDTAAACKRAGWAVESEPGRWFPHNANANGRLAVTLQTGSQQDDPYFQGDIVFTTIDQLLSAYILDPVSLPGRLANINVGALLGSLVVFDEFHLLQPDKSMGTAIEMLDRLRPFCRFVLMTATLSDDAVAWLANKHGADVVELGDDEISLLENRKKPPTRREWVWCDEPLTADAVLRRPRGRSLVILNSVERAQRIYRELVRRRPEGTCLLHSRFFSADRAPKETEAMRRLGRAGQGKDDDFILVSTQVVEAGMDFSVDVLHTELAPVNSLVQRAGRCARYGGDGTVLVYCIPHPAPYDAEAVETTKSILCDLSGRVLASRDEMQAVDRVHSPLETGHLRTYDNLYTRRQEVARAMDRLTEGAKEKLIRDVNSVNVLLTGEPQEIVFGSTDGWPEMLSVPSRTLRSFLKRTETEPGDWVVALPSEVEEEGDTRLGFRFRWRRSLPGNAGLPWMVAVNPRYARYTPEEGLVLGEGGKQPAVQRRARRIQAGYRYRCETFSDHVRLVMEHLERILDHHECAQRRLVEGFGLTAETVRTAVRLTAVLHDTGKLSTGWQGATRTWQEYKTPGKVPSEPIAHTDFDPRTDREAKKGFRSPPNHAAEGAYAMIAYLLAVFEDVQDVAVCILTAVARHHSGHARTLTDYALVPGAEKLVSVLASEIGLPPVRLADKPEISACGPNGAFSGNLLTATRADDAKWLPLYWYLVRCLRLADQAGTAEGGKA